MLLDSLLQNSPNSIASLISQLNVHKISPLLQEIEKNKAYAIVNNDGARLDGCKSVLIDVTNDSISFHDYSINGISIEFLDGFEIPQAWSTERFTALRDDDSGTLVLVNKSSEVTKQCLGIFVSKNSDRKYNGCLIVKSEKTVEALSYLKLNSDFIDIVTMSVN